MGIALAVFSVPMLAADVYFNNFNGPIGSTFPEWTSTGYTNTANKAGTVAAGSGPQAVSTVASPKGGQRFLGEFGGPVIVAAPPYDPEHFVRVDETVTLTLHDLQPHTLTTVVFDLYILKSWDGNNPNYGPDRWSLRVQDGPTLLDSTFSNNPKTGAYDLSQQNYPITNSTYQTAAAKVNTLGYTFYGDSIYHLSFAFKHTSDSLILNFSSSLFEGKGTDDESWGLDNVRVSTNADGPVAGSTAAPGAGLAPQSLGSIYGLDLAAGSDKATPPWPTMLAGVSVTATDRTQSDRAVPLISVSPQQIDFEVPDGIQTGSVAFSVQTGMGSTLSLSANVADTAPALFTANGDGMGVVAADAFRMIAESRLTATVPVFDCSAGIGNCVSVPIDLGIDSPVYVMLYGTGIRGAADSVSVLIAGVAVPVLYAGPRSDMDGTDQINIALPLSLRGSGEVDVVVQMNGALSNTGRINIL